MLRFFFMLLSLAALGTPRVAAEIIRIDDVEIEISAANPTEARERAFLEARRTGYRLALQSIGQTVPARVSDEQVNAAVSAIEVTSERQSANRYSARFSLFVEFPDSPSRPVDASTAPAAGLAPSATTARQGAWIYVIPAERTEGRIERIWRRDAAWTHSFRAVSPIAGQSPLTPSGDEADRALVAPTRLAAGDAGALAALSQRHNAPVAAVILDRGPPTRPGRSDGTIQGVEVLYWSKTTGAQSLKRTFTDRTLITTANAIAQALLEQIISPEPPDAPAPTAAASAAPEDPAKPPPASAPSIDPSPASATTPSPAPAPSTSPDEAALPQIIRPFAYDIGSVEDWRRLRARLEAIPDLVFTPSLITTERIVGQLHYSGQSDALMALLAAAGLAKSPAPVPEPVLPPVLATSPPLVADAAPLPAPAEERAEPESGSFAVHLVSTRSEAEAVLEWGRLYQRFPEILASRTPVYRSVDLGADRGVWWRLGVAGFTGRRDAEAWCARLAAVNQHCRVAAQ